MPESEPVTDASAGPLKRLYTWVLSWAESPYGAAGLFGISFVESSFFPIPPDPLLIALCLGLVSRSLYFAAVCTVGSVLGGLFGYWIGASAYVWLGAPIIEFYGKADDFAAFQETFNAWGDYAILVAAISPVPYKVMTITAGVAGMNLPMFVVTSIVGRGLRFFALAGLVYWKGEVIGPFIDRHFDKLAIAFTVLLVGGFAAMRLLLH